MRVDPYGVETGKPPTGEQIVAELSRRATAPTILTPQYRDAVPFIVTRGPDGNERIEYLTMLAEAPNRKVGTISAHDAAAFIAYFSVHGAGVPHVYASLSPVQFVAVLNDHTKDKANFRDYRLNYAVKHSPEWTSWNAHNGKGASFKTDTFAAFIEENSPDFVSPDAAAMLQIALNFRIRQNVHYDNAERQQDGSVEFAYRVTQSTVSAQGTKIKIPETFGIKIRVWDGPDAKLYPMKANLRYRLSEGDLTIWYELERPKRIMEQAFKDLWEEIEKGTKAKVLFATPG